MTSGGTNSSSNLSAFQPCWAGWMGRDGRMLDFVQKVWIKTIHSVQHDSCFFKHIQTYWNLFNMVKIISNDQRQQHGWFNRQNG